MGIPEEADSPAPISTRIRVEDCKCDAKSASISGDGGSYLIFLVSSSRDWKCLCRLAFALALNSSLKSFGRGIMK